MSKKNYKRLQEFLTSTKNHPILNRREFLSRWGAGIFSTSLIPFSGAFGDDQESIFPEGICDLSINSAMTPTLIIDLAGGGHLIGSNFIVSQSTDGNQLGDLGYDARGLGISDNVDGLGKLNEAKIDQSFGISMHSDSKILEGMKAAIGAGDGPNLYSQSVDGGVICASTLDDTQLNEINPLYWICNSGCIGKFRPSLGNLSTRSGGFSTIPEYNNLSKNLPVPISKEENLIKLLEISRLANKQSPEQQGELLKLIEDLNINGLIQRKEKFSDSLRNRLYCDYKIPRKVLTDPNIRIDDLKIPSDGIISNTFTSPIENKSLDTFKVFSHLLLNKYFGVGSISLNGFDYHDGSRAAGDIKDYELGYNIGAVIKSAVDLGKNIVLMIITDGGVGVDLSGGTIDQNGRIAWVADRGTASAGVILAINGAGKSKPKTRTAVGGDVAKRQVGRILKGIGNYTYDNLQVDLKHHPITSQGGVGLASGLFANYLALHGMEGKLGEFAGIDLFSSSDGSVLDDYLIFDQTFNES